MGTLIVALDKFKGSHRRGHASAALARGLRRHRPDLQVRHCPVADGGEGTLDALAAAGFTRVPVTADGPTGAPVRTELRRPRRRRRGRAGRRLRAGPAPRRPPSAATALTATTHRDRPGRRGRAGRRPPHDRDRPGRQRQHRRRRRPGRPRSARGCSTPAAATCRAGRRRAGRAGPDRPGPGCTPGCGPGADRAELVVACDVDNPLLGPVGAAAVYGPQKGAAPEQVAQLDAALARWAGLLEAATGTRVAADDPAPGRPAGSGSPRSPSGLGCAAASS